MKIRGVRLEHLTDPLVIGTGAPRISRQITDAPTGWRQNGYTIEIRELQPGAKAVMAQYDVESAEQVLVPWPAAKCDRQ